MESPGRDAHGGNPPRASPRDPNKDGQPDHLHVPGGQTLRPEFAQEVVALEEVAA